VPQLVSPPASPHDEQRSSRHHDDDQTFRPFQPQPGLARPLIDLDPWYGSQHELRSPASINDADAAKRSVSYFTLGEIFSAVPLSVNYEVPDTKLFDDLYQLFEKHGFLT
jgi:hypothetical protein